MRIAAASAALLLIAIVVAVTAGSGNDGQDKSEPATPTAPNRPPSEEGEHGEHFTNIYVLDLGNRRLRKVTEYQLAQHPAWAPSSRIAFSSANDDEDYAHLFEVDERGTNQVLIRAGVRHLFHPTWSPDRRSLAAVALGRGLYTIRLRDHKTRRLTSNQSDEAPAWAPRGNWIAFDKRVGGENYDLFAVNAVTRKVRRLTRGPLQQTNPSWSPDGSRIAYAEQQRNGRWAIVTMRIDGSDRRRITNKRTSGQEPSWSPDGKSIAFIDQQLDSARVAVVPAEGGSKPKVLTRESLFASKPAWSPDGRRIAFSGAPPSE